MSLTYATRRALLTPNKGVGFSLDAFMAAQADGFWYDFTKTDRLFQENVGPTPAAANGDVIGLAYDQRAWGGKTLAQVLAASPEMSPNSGGPFVSVAGYLGVAANLSIVGGLLRITSAVNGVSARAADIRVTGLVVGTVYQLSVSAPGPRLPNVDVRSFQIRDAAGVAVLANGVDLTSGLQGALTFTATETSCWIRLRWDGGAGATTATYVDYAFASLKAVPGRPATQATTSLKPKLAATGTAFDGSDDNLLTGYTAGAGDNFLIAKVRVPASIPAGAMVGGSAGGSGTSRFYIGFNPTGEAMAGIGGNNNNVIKGAIDRRGQDVVVGVSVNGATVRLFDVDTVAYEAAQSGITDNNVPLRLGCYNNNGNALSLFGGSIRSFVAGRQFLDLDTFKKIAAAL